MTEASITGLAVGHVEYPDPGGPLESDAPEPEVDDSEQE